MPNIPVEPIDWFTDERRLGLEKDLGHSFPILNELGILKKVILQWTRRQISIDSPLSPTEIEQLQMEVSSIPDLGEWEQTQRSRKLIIAQACRDWARKTFAPRVESLFLQNKSHYDHAAIHLFRCSDKFLTLELYHRIKANETTFEEVATKYSSSPESENGGRIPLLPLNRLPYGIAPVVRKLDPGALSMPLRIGDHFCVIRVDDFKPAQLTEELKNELIDNYLVNWLNLCADHIYSTLTSRPQSLLVSSK